MAATHFGVALTVTREVGLCLHLRTRIRRASVESLRGQVIDVALPQCRTHPTTLLRDVPPRDEVSEIDVDNHRDRVIEHSADRIVGVAGERLLSTGGALIRSANDVPRFQ